MSDGPDLRRAVSEYDLGKRYRLTTATGIVEGVLDFDKTPTILPLRRGYALVMDGGYQIRLTPADRLRRVP